MIFDHFWIKDKVISHFDSLSLLMFPMLSQTHFNQKHCVRYTHSPCDSALAPFNLFNIDSLNKQVLNHCVHLWSRIKCCLHQQYFPKCVFLMKIYISAKNTPLSISSQAESFSRKLRVENDPFEIKRPCFLLQPVSLIGECAGSSFNDRKCFINNSTVQSHLKVLN